ncbi:MAG: hypothetical protein HYY63_06905, partial [Elusimicrobia bacterium]|nr:hypothetical protein [Elusimicrobiota bacterium]
MNTPQAKANIPKQKMSTLVEKLNFINDSLMAPAVMSKVPMLTNAEPINSFRESLSKLMRVSTQVIPQQPHAVKPTGMRSWMAPWMLVWRSFRAPKSLRTVTAITALVLLLNCLPVFVGGASTVSWAATGMSVAVNEEINQLMNLPQDRVMRELRSRAGRSSVPDNLFEGANTPQDRELMSQAIQIIQSANRSWPRNLKGIIVSDHAFFGAMAITFKDGSGYVILNRSRLNGRVPQAVLSLIHELQHILNRQSVADGLVSPEEMTSQRDESIALTATAEAEILVNTTWPGAYSQQAVNSQYWFAHRVNDDPAIPIHEEATRTTIDRVFVPYKSAIGFLETYIGVDSKSIVYVTSEKRAAGYDVVFKGRETK